MPPTTNPTKKIALTKSKPTRSQSSQSDHAKLEEMLAPAKEIINNINLKCNLNYSQLPRHLRISSSNRNYTDNVPA